MSIRVSQDLACVVERLSPLCCAYPNAEHPAACYILSCSVFSNYGYTAGDGECAAFVVHRTVDAPVLSPKSLPEWPSHGPVYRHGVKRQRSYVSEVEDEARSLRMSDNVARLFSPRTVSGSISLDPDWDCDYIAKRVDDTLLVPAGRRAARPRYDAVKFKQVLRAVGGACSAHTAKNELSNSSCILVHGCNGNRGIILTHNKR